jgi:leader peptidase (prepilin peptidase)/N-methyltransferase
MLLVLAALVGLVFGSFLTVVVSRVPDKRSVVAPRSGCPRCGNLIRARDNIPVLSYLLLRGQCRSCGGHISLGYPALELATAGLFLAAVIVIRSVVVATIVGPFLGVLMACAVIDIRHRIIPNAIVLPSAALFGAAIAATAIAGYGFHLVTAVMGCLALGGGLFAIAMISPRSLGMGDVKLGGLIGLMMGALGWKYVAVAAFAAVLVGGVVAIAALAAGKGRKSAIPFGPSLAAGATVAALLAPQVASWYGRFLR